MTNHKRCLELLSACLFMMVTLPIRGQILHRNGPLPSFEVATIKPWKADLRPMGAPVPIKVDPMHRVRRLEGDHVEFIGQIGLLIMDAYNLPVGSERRIVKGPAWVNSESDRYEVQAKIDASLFTEMQKMSPEQQHEQVALMEQSLLEERFHFKVHFEIRGETPTYSLVIAKGGPKLTPANAEEKSSISALRNQISAQAVTLDQFARSPLWTPIGDRFVVDQTKLTGTYDFTLKWRPDQLDDSAVVQGAEDLPPLFDALQEQLGLKVIDSRSPLEVLVIDHIERPSSN